MNLNVHSSATFDVERSATGVISTAKVSAYLSNVLGQRPSMTFGIGPSVSWKASGAGTPYHQPPGDTNTKQKEWNIKLFFEKETDWDEWKGFFYFYLLTDKVMSWASDRNSSLHADRHYEQLEAVAELWKPSLSTLTASIRKHNKSHQRALLIHFLLNIHLMIWIKTKCGAVLEHFGDGGHSWTWLICPGKFVKVALRQS